MDGLINRHTTESIARDTYVGIVLFRTAVPFWGQTIQILSGVPPKTGVRYQTGQGVSNNVG